MIGNFNSDEKTQRLVLDAKAGEKRIEELFPKSRLYLELDQVQLIAGLSNPCV